MHIQKVVLHTAHLEELYTFYTQQLQLSLIEKSATYFSICAGETTLIFTQSTTGQPFYHYAFDIPSTQFDEAKTWIQQRVPLLTEKGEDDVYFATIDAKSIYFEDPAGNIVEFIARFHTTERHTLPFSEASILRMSEMSLVVADKVAAAKQLEAVQIVPRNGGRVETEGGLYFLTQQNMPIYLLLVSPFRRWFFSTKEALIFPQMIHLKDGTIIAIDEQHQLHVKKPLSL